MKLTGVNWGRNWQMQEGLSTKQLSPLIPSPPQREFFICLLVFCKDGERSRVF